METEGLNFQSMNLPKEEEIKIEEYLDFMEDRGYSILQSQTDDIIKTIGQLKARGVEFFVSPHTYYYEAIPERLGEHMKMMKEDLNELEKLAIIMDEMRVIYCKFHETSAG
jgi:4-hydroxyphenylpyruvate dioxygenase